ncbi:MAG: hypothetical protein Q4F84_09650, partial [Fibrobacter sp.]|nr:hypothetical protein [Fibrobacter sp.]
NLLKKYEYKGNEISIGSPYALKFNSWSAKKWINGPPEIGTKCVYQIDWVKFTPHSSGVKDNKTGYRHSVPEQFKKSAIHNKNASAGMFNIRGQKINGLPYVKSPGVYFSGSRNNLLTVINVD